MLTVPTVIFSQGDTVLMQLTATDGDGNPINITGSTFTTYIKGAGGLVFAFNNSQHSIVDGPSGIFSLALSSIDSANCGLGSNKDIVTNIVNGSQTILFRGTGILQVNPPVPLA